MNSRRASRLLVVDRDLRVLLLRFEFREGALRGGRFWATPGGGLEAGESFAAAARRELFEETGLVVADPGPEVAQRTVRFVMPSGEWVEADERFFLIHVGSGEVSALHRTSLERDAIAGHGWYGAEELAALDVQVWPEDLAPMLVEVGVWA